MSDDPTPDDAEVDMLPRSTSVSFLHAVGQSTIRQGFAVPTIAQISWLAEIPKGTAVPVIIQYDSTHTAEATLRRINNARGHLQFRYESAKQSGLREYLVAIFGEADDATGVLRVTECAYQRFLFEPISAGKRTTAALSVCKPHFHNCSELSISEFTEFQELRSCMATIPYNEEHNQSRYNLEIASALSRNGWSCESRIVDQIGLRCDFEKNGVWVEVEFGNARVYYQDYIKLLLAVRHRSARLGVFLSPTNAFAQLLCDLGQRRAIVRRGDSTKKQPSYSGMMSYEKAIRELPYLEFMLTSSLVVAGIEIQKS